jgi:hypothetical protein
VHGGGRTHREQQARALPTPNFLYEASDLWARWPEILVKPYCNLYRHEISLVPITGISMNCPLESLCELGSGSA